MNRTVIVLSLSILLTGCVIPPQPVHEDSNPMVNCIHSNNARFMGASLSGPEVYNHTMSSIISECKAILDYQVEQHNQSYGVR